MRARTLLFPAKLTPAKASLNVQRRLADHVRVISVIDPASLDYLELVAADLRARAEISTQVRERRTVQWI